MDHIQRLAAACSGKSAIEVIGQAPEHARSVLERRASATAHWLARHATADERQQRRDALVERLANAEDVLFLCHGNICRSPFAERYARNVLAGRTDDDETAFTVRSAGLTVLTDPRSPLEAREMAADYGVSLDGHLASAVTAGEMARADVVFLMDYRNLETVRERFPDALGRTFMLRIFEDGPAMQIHDPYRRGPAAFQTAYDAVATCVDELVEAADGSSGSAGLAHHSESGAMPPRPNR